MNKILVFILIYNELKNQKINFFDYLIFVIDLFFKTIKSIDN